jgi:hypothetical protein
LQTDRSIPQNCAFRRPSTPSCNPKPKPLPLQRLDLRDIKVVSKVGGTIDDSELVEGCVFDSKVRA